MSTDSTPTEVFEEIEPDPDAILEACDAASPESLVESGGEHEPTTDSEIDATDETASRLFDDLQSLACETTDTGASARGDEPDEHTADADERDGFVATADTVYPAEPTVVVNPSEEPDRSTSDDASESDAGLDLTLVGPDPTVTRVENDAFGGATSSEQPSDFQWVGEMDGEMRG